LDARTERVIAFRRRIGDHLIPLLQTMPTPLREPAALNDLPFTVVSVHARRPPIDSGPRNWWLRYGPPAEVRE